MAMIAALAIAGCATTDQSAGDARRFTQIDAPPLTTDRASTGGVSYADIDGDGDADAMITNGYDVSSSTPEPQDNKFYENRDGVFVAMNPEGLIDIKGYGSGSVWADFDNDGDLDGFLSNQRDQRNFYVEQAPPSGAARRFQSMESAPLTTDGGWSYSVAAADADNDGYLDVYVSNGGLGHSGVNFFYRNDGGEKFIKIEDQPLASQNQPSGGAAWADYDNDGDQDLIVANRGSGADRALGRLALYRNDGALAFTRVDKEAFAADPESPMSVAWGDVDNDGDLDLYTASLYGLANALFENRGDGTFAVKDGGDATTEPGFSYSSTFGDFDNDGDLDLVVGNWGAVSQIFLNDGTGRFTRLATDHFRSSIHYAATVAIADTDGDGDLDMLVGNWPNSPGVGLEENVLIENDFARGDWLRIALEGTASNRSGVGARLELRYVQDGAQKLQIREVATQSGWRSQNELVQHFGLGAGANGLELTIRWPSGAVQSVDVSGKNQTLKVREADGA